MKAAQTHDDTVVEMLKADPEMADLYLAAALEEVNLPGRQGALLGALRHIAEAQGQPDCKNHVSHWGCWPALGRKS
ncbi:MAG: hypothetical protein WCI85_02450 [Comamonadaceae bacterium]